MGQQWLAPPVCSRIRFQIPTIRVRAPRGHGGRLCRYACAWAWRYGRACGLTPSLESPNQRTTTVHLPESLPAVILQASEVEVTRQIHHCRVVHIASVLISLFRIYLCSISTRRHFLSQRMLCLPFCGCVLCFRCTRVFTMNIKTDLALDRSAHFTRGLLAHI